MTERTATSYFASIVLHALCAAVIFFYAYAFRSDEVNTKLIQLVAGEGDNYMATEAPALGSPDSTKTDPLPPDAAAAAAPAPPITPAAFEAVPAPPTVTKPKAEPKTPDLTKALTRAADRAEKRNLKKFEEEQKRLAEQEAKRLAAEKAADAKKMTKEEFDKKYAGKTGSTGRSTNPDAPIKVAKLDAKGIAGGVVGGSTSNTVGGAGGKALSREESDWLTAYLSHLVQELKKAHERPTGLSDLLSAAVECTIGTDGTLSGVRIVRSSGSAEFDQSVLSAFRNVGTAGPRRDNGGPIKKTFVFKMSDD